MIRLSEAVMSIPGYQKVKKQNLWCRGKAEAQVAQPAVWRVVVAIRRPGVTGEAAPAAAAIHPVRAFREPFTGTNTA